MYWHRDNEPSVSATELSVLEPLERNGKVDEKRFWNGKLKNRPHECLLVLIEEGQCCKKWTPCCNLSHCVAGKSKAELSKSKLKTEEGKRVYNNLGAKLLAELKVKLRIYAACN